MSHNHSQRRVKGGTCWDSATMTSVWNGSWTGVGIERQGPVSGIHKEMSLIVWYGESRSSVYSTPTPGKASEEYALGYTAQLTLEHLLWVFHSLVYLDQQRGREKATMYWTRGAVLLWKLEDKMGISKAVVKGSLPHLTKQQRRDFASCLLHMPATVPASPWWHCVCLYGWKDPGTESRARVDQSRDSSRNSSLFLCRRSVNRVLMCPSEVSHQPCYFQPLQEKKKSQTTTATLGNVHENTFYLGKVTGTMNFFLKIPCAEDQ